MIQGLYAAASGMMAVEDQQAIIANNLANASTAGFKRQDSVTEGFYEVLLHKMVDPAFLNAQKFPGGGIRLGRTYTDYADGGLAATGDPLNVALVGPGFLRVETPEGQRFTRDGRLIINTAGQLATLDGYAVLGQGEVPITVSGANLEFDDQGNVFADGQNVGRLLITEFENPSGLSRSGVNLYQASGAALASSKEGESTQVVGKALEMSNVRVPAEMARMMVGLRAYGAYQRVVNSTDETVGRLIDQVAMPI